MLFSRSKIISLHFLKACAVMCEVIQLLYSNDQYPFNGQMRIPPMVAHSIALLAGDTGSLSLASPGVPGNCRKQCSVPGKLPGDPMVVLVGQMGILSAHAWCGTSVKTRWKKPL